jgi:hypothetical protein
MSRDDIILAALRLCSAYAAGETPPAEDITNCAQALNIIVKEMVTEGLPLWCVQDIAVPLAAGQATYNLSTITGMTLPLRILDGYLHNTTSGNDVSIMPTSRYDWDALGNKTLQGVPNQAFYDPQLGAGTLHLYPVPADNLSSYHVVIQRQIQDFNLSTDNPDFPQEAFRLLKWCLADEIGLEYQTPEATRREINQKAQNLKTKFFDFEQEFVSVTFTPSERAQ